MLAVLAVCAVGSAFSDDDPGPAPERVAAPGATPAPAHALVDVVEPVSPLRLRSVTEARADDAEPGLEPDGQLARRVRDAALRYREGRRNAFFKEEDLLLDVAAEGPGAITALQDFLHDTAPLEALDPATSIVLERPAAVMERMAMLDLLGDLAGSEPEALRALDELVAEPVARELPEHVRRVLLVEKYEALVALARHDWPAAVDRLASYEGQGLQATLRGALVDGLVDAGLPPDEARERVRAL